MSASTVAGKIRGSGEASRDEMGASERSDVPVHVITNALRSVIDPELRTSIVDLGMLRGFKLHASGALEVDIALTVASCPLRSQIADDVRQRLLHVNGVESVEVRTVAMTTSERSELMAKVRWKARDNAARTDIPQDAPVLAIASGKGGVGKSSITVNLAVALARSGLAVGVLDADIWGFSIPRMLQLDAEVEVSSSKMIPIPKPIGDGQLKVMSMGFLASENSAIMWRGLVLNRAFQQFLEDVRWEGIDYLLIDMPPGTGDLQMGLARMLPRAEMIVVTTPSLSAQKVAARVGDMARKGYLRIAGVIENMAPFDCAHGETHALFGSGGGQRLADDLGAPLLGSIPLDPAMTSAADAGEPVALGGDATEASPTARAFQAIAARLADEVQSPVEMAGCTARMLENVRAALGPVTEKADRVPTTVVRQPTYASSHHSSSVSPLEPT